MKKPSTQTPLTILVVALLFATGVQVAQIKHRSPNSGVNRTAASVQKNSNAATVVTCFREADAVCARTIKSLKNLENLLSRSSRDFDREGLWTSEMTAISDEPFSLIDRLHQASVHNQIMAMNCVGYGKQFHIEYPNELTRIQAILDDRSSLRALEKANSRLQRWAKHMKVAKSSASFDWFGPAPAIILDRVAVAKEINNALLELGYSLQQVQVEYLRLLEDPAMCGSLFGAKWTNPGKRAILLRKIAKYRQQSKDFAAALGRYKLECRKAKRQLRGSRL